MSTGVLRSSCYFDFALLTFVILESKRFDLLFALRTATLKISDPLLDAHALVHQVGPLLVEVQLPSLSSRDLLHLQRPVAITITAV